MTTSEWQQIVSKIVKIETQSKAGDTYRGISKSLITSRLITSTLNVKKTDGSEQIYNMIICPYYDEVKKIQIVNAIAVQKFLE
jgi:hypothetical protein